jgi:hypothetical protein
MVNCKLRRIASLVLTLFLMAPAAYGETLSLAQSSLYQTATDGVTDVESTATHSFGQHITFTIHVTSDAKVTQVHLFFRAAGNEQTEFVSVDFEQTSSESGHEANASYMHDLRRSPLPPFATVTFWWNIEDATGRKIETEPTPHEYTDDRFEWEQLSDNGITTHWIKDQGDPALGQAALDVARISVEEINAELHAPVPESIKIYIYDTQPNLSAAMGLTRREWVVGQAHPELNVILVAIPFKDGYTSLIKHYIPHEITHLLIYQKVTPSGYKYVPEWLDEGLATANEQLPTPDHTLIIEEASVHGQLLSLESLCVPFPPDYQTAFLAYAQSGSVVKFIRKQYGADGIRRLFTAYANGASCTTGVQEALDINLNDLDAVWRTSLGIVEENSEQDLSEQNPPEQTPETPEDSGSTIVEQAGIWVGLWILSMLVAVPMIGGLRNKL